MCDISGGCNMLSWAVLITDCYVKPRGRLELLEPTARPELGKRRSRRGRWGARSCRFPRHQEGTIAKGTRRHLGSRCKPQPATLVVLWQHEFYRFRIPGKEVTSARAFPVLWVTLYTHKNDLSATWPAVLSLMVTNDGCRWESTGTGSVCNYTSPECFPNHGTLWVRASWMQKWSFCCPLFFNTDFFDCLLTLKIAQYPMSYGKGFLTWLSGKGISPVF